jgi:hypothetical protein
VHSSLRAATSSRRHNTFSIGYTCHAAPRQYAPKLCGLLTRAGARPLWVPCIQITATESKTDVDALTSELSSLSDFTHVAFTSKNGIHAVLAQLERMHGSTAAARTAVAESGVRICALGADALVLKVAGYPVHLLPSEPSTQGMVSELRRRKEAAGARVLCPVPKVTGAHFATTVCLEMCMLCVHWCVAACACTLILEISRLSGFTHFLLLGALEALRSSAYRNHLQERHPRDSGAARTHARQQHRSRTHSSCREQRAHLCA